MNPKRRFSYVFWVLTALAILVFLAGTFLLHKVFPSSTLESIDNKNYSVEKATSDVKIIYPKGGEIFKKGGAYELEWTGGGETIDVFLIDKALESQGVSVSSADRVYGIKNEGNYTYAFSKKLPTGTYKFDIGNSETGYFSVEP